MTPIDVLTETFPTELQFLRAVRTAMARAWTRPGLSRYLLTVLRTNSTEAEARAKYRLKSLCGDYLGITHWERTEGRTQADVLDLLDRAIAEAEAA